MENTLLYLHLLPVQHCQQPNSVFSHPALPCICMISAVSSQGSPPPTLYSHPGSQSESRVACGVVSCDMCISCSAIIYLKSVWNATHWSSHQFQFRSLTSDGEKTWTRGRTRAAGCLLHCLYARPPALRRPFRGRRIPHFVHRGSTCRGLVVQYMICTWLELMCYINICLSIYVYLFNYLNVWIFELQIGTAWNAFIAIQYFIPNIYIYIYHGLTLCKTLLWYHSSPYLFFSFQNFHFSSAVTSLFLTPFRHISSFP